MSRLSTMLSALQNADMAYIGQWPLALRLIGMVVAVGGTALALWVLQLQEAYQNLAALQAQLQQESAIVQDLRGKETVLRKRLTTSAPVAATTPSALDSLHVSAQAHSVRLIRLERTATRSKPEPTKGASKGSATHQTADKVSRSQKQDWTVELGANYTQWMSWLSTMLTGRWLWRVHQFEVERIPHAGQGRNLRIRMTLSEAGPRFAFGEIDSAQAGRTTTDHARFIAKLFAPAPNRLRQGVHSEVELAANPAQVLMLELLGTVELGGVESGAAELAQDHDAAPQSSAIRYQAVIRQGQRVHILDPGQNFMTQDRKEVWRLESASARSAILREIKTGRTQQLVMQKADEETSP